MRYINKFSSYHSIDNETEIFRLILHIDLNICLNDISIVRVGMLSLIFSKKIMVCIVAIVALSHIYMLLAPTMSGRAFNITY